MKIEQVIKKVRRQSVYCPHGSLQKTKKKNSLSLRLFRSLYFSLSTRLSNMLLSFLSISLSQKKKKEKEKESIILC